jgi:hypothetical protein
VFNVLTVRVEAVDAMFDLGEDATGGIQLADSNNRHYHLRNVERMQLWGCVWRNTGVSNRALQVHPVGGMRRLVKFWPRCVCGGLKVVIAPYHRQMEAPSFRKTRAFVRPKAVLWLDSEYAVENDTKGRIFGAVG